MDLSVPPIRFDDSRIVDETEGKESNDEAQGRTTEYERRDEPLAAVPVWPGWRLRELVSSGCSGPGRAARDGDDAGGTGGDGSRSGRGRSAVGGAGYPLCPQRVRRGPRASARLAGEDRPGRAATRCRPGARRQHRCDGDADRLVACCRRGDAATRCRPRHERRTVRTGV